MTSHGMLLVGRTAVAGDVSNAVRGRHAAAIISHVRKALVAWVSASQLGFQLPVYCIGVGYPR